LKEEWLTVWRHILAVGGMLLSPRSDFALTMLPDRKEAVAVGWGPTYPSSRERVWTRRCLEALGWRYWEVPEPLPPDELARVWAERMDAEGSSHVYDLTPPLSRWSFGIIQEAFRLKGGHLPEPPPGSFIN
jgi:hypothetical protein